MSLIALLIAIAVERVRHPHRHWHFKLLYQRAFDWLEYNTYGTLVFWLVLIAPVIMLQWLLWSVAEHYFGLFTFIIWVSIPIWIIGCPGYQKMYRQYLQSAAGGDQQACCAFVSNMVQAEHSTYQEFDQSIASKVGQQLIWVNYRYYFATIFYFALLGPAGALFYAGVRELAQWQVDHPEKHLKAELVIRILDWLPTRVMILGLALVGNFSKVLPLLITSLFDINTAEREWIAKVALVSEDLDASHNNLCMQTTFKLVALAKRNILLFISLIAILTIYGCLV